MSDNTDNPNNVVKYCVDCIHFKRPFPDFWVTNGGLCKKIVHESSSADKLVAPKYNKVAYERAAWIRKIKCMDKYWEPK